MEREDQSVGGIDPSTFKRARRDPISTSQDNLQAAAPPSFPFETTQVYSTPVDNEARGQSQSEVKVSEPGGAVAVGLPSQVQFEMEHIELINPVEVNQF